MRRSNARPPEVILETSRTMSVVKPHQLRPPLRFFPLLLPPQEPSPPSPGHPRRLRPRGRTPVPLRSLEKLQSPQILDRCGWREHRLSDPRVCVQERNPDNAGESLVELLEFAKVTVPREVWEDTELRLMATAGLRLLNTSVVNRILESGRKVLRSYDFRFQNDWASVNSGRQ